MAKPKLALIPAAQGDKFYSVLPSDGVGDFTFARASTGTRIAPTGLIEEVPSGDSRLNYDLLNGKVVNCPHYILEPASTNLVPNSQDFSSGWTFDDTTITSNSAISPDGVLNASLLKGNTVSSKHNITINPSLTANVTASFSLFVKAKELKYIQIASGNSTNQYVNFDVSAGYIGSVGSSFSNAKIQNYGNGWYRCSVVSANYSGFIISLVSGLTAIWRESWVMPNDTDGLYIYGVQLEQSSYPTSYIPTNGTAITRAAESATGSGDAATFNDSEGVLMFEGSNISENNSTTISIALSDGSLSNSISLYYFGAIGLYYDIFNSSGTRSGNIPMTKLQQANNNKIALKYKSQDISLFVNGFELLTNSGTLSLNGLSEVSFDYGNGQLPFYGNTREVQYFDSALTDAQLETLTSWTSLQEMITSQLYTNY